MKHSFAKLLLAIAVILAANGLAYAQTGPNNTPTIPSQIYHVVPTPPVNSQPTTQSTAANSNCIINDPLSCTTTNAPFTAITCPSNATSCQVGGAPYWGMRSDPGNAANPVDVWGYCRYIDNTSSGATATSYFVPFNTPLEWGVDPASPHLGFLSNTPQYINPQTCARPGSLQVPDDFQGFTPPQFYDPNYTCDQAAYSPAVPLPYGPTNSFYPPAPLVETFPCTVVGICDNTVTPPNCGASQPWTETATVTFQAGVAPDNDTQTNGVWNNPGWSIASITYGGNKPPPNPPPPINGQCGPASGTQVSSAPSSGLCNAGNPTAVAGNGPWTWSCLGLDGGTDDTSCNAPAQNGVYCGVWDAGGPHSFVIIRACATSASSPQFLAQQCNGGGCPGDISWQRCGGGNNFTNPLALNCPGLPGDWGSFPNVSNCTPSGIFVTTAWYLCQ